VEANTSKWKNFVNREDQRKQQTGIKSYADAVHEKEILHQHGYNLYQKYIMNIHLQDILLTLLRALARHFQ
jgi:hypothetical protein